MGGETDAHRRDQRPHGRGAPDASLLRGAAALLPLGLLSLAGVLALTPIPWPALLLLWGVLGAATSLVLTPSARLLRRHSTDADRPAVFAAQFSLSHACFVLTYPLAGVLGARVGLSAVALALAVVAVVATAAALLLWRPGPRAAVGAPGQDGRRRSRTHGSSRIPAER